MGVRWTSRVTQVIAVALAGTLLVALSACGNPNSTGKVISSPTATPTSTATARSTPAPTATQQTASDGWQVYADTQFGFHVEVASYLTRTGPQPWNAPGEYVEFEVSNAAHGWEQAWVYVDPQASGSVCAQDLSGDAVTVGSGLTGYQHFVAMIPTPPTGGGGTNSPHMELSFLASGTLIMFKLWGDPPAVTFSARYGNQWQHLLASFIPGPAYPGGHACR
jgi:hypothetical protein